MYDVLFKLGAVNVSALGIKSSILGKDRLTTDPRLINLFDMIFLSVLLGDEKMKPLFTKRIIYANLD